MQLSTARFIFGVVATVALAGCNVAQPPSETPLIVRQDAVRPPNTDDLYVAAGKNGYVLAYNSGKVRGNLDFRIGGQRGYTNGLCSDSFGNVFVTVYSASYVKIFKYVYNSTKPDVTLSDPIPTPVSCAVSDLGQTLAVAESFPTEGLHAVSLYLHERGKPQVIYDLANVSAPAYCTYDATGDLFIDGQTDKGNFALAELPKGSAKFVKIAASGVVTTHPGNLQWIGDDLTIAIPQSQKILTLKVSGGTATVLRTTPIDGWGVKSTPQTWIFGHTFIAPMGSDAENIGRWRYPKGGNPRTLGTFKADAPISGVAMSRLPS
jgi:hypothetical protein